MASISYRDHFLHYYRHDIECYNQTDCERDLNVMEKWLSESAKPSHLSSLTQQEYFVHANLFISSALSNSFFSNSEHAEIRAHVSARLRSIRKRFTKLIKENEVNKKEFFELSLKFQRLLRRKKILIRKLNHTNIQIAALKAQLEHTPQDLHIVNLHRDRNLDKLDEVGMKIADLAERIIFLETALS